MFIAFLIFQIQTIKATICSFKSSVAQPQLQTNGFELSFIAPSNISYVIISTTLRWDQSNTTYLQGSGYNCLNYNTNTYCISQSTTPVQFKCENLSEGTSYVITCSNINTPAQFLIPEGYINATFYNQNDQSLEEECTNQKVSGFLGGSGIKLAYFIGQASAPINTSQSLQMTISFTINQQKDDKVEFSLVNSNSIATLDYDTSINPTFSTIGSVTGDKIVFMINAATQYITLPFKLNTSYYSGYVSFNITIYKGSSTDIRSYLSTSFPITPGVITVNNITLYNMIYSKKVNYIIILQLENALSLGGYIIIPTPSGLTLSNCQNGYKYSCDASDGNFVKIVTTNFIESGTITLNIEFQNPSTSSNIVFKGIQSFYKSSTTYVLDQQSIKYTLTGFNDGKLESIDYQVDNDKVGSTSGISYSFTTKNYIPKVNSSIRITIPSEVAFIPNDDCQISFSQSITGTCNFTIDNTTGVVTLNLSSDVPPDAKVNLIINNCIQNPYSSAPNTDTGFSLTIQNGDIIYDSIVQFGTYPLMKINSYIKLQYVNRSNTFNGGDTNLNLSITFETYQPEESILSIKLSEFSFNTISVQFNNSQINPISQLSNIIEISLPQFVYTQEQQIIIDGLINPDSTIPIQIIASTYYKKNNTMYMISTTSAENGLQATILDSSSGTMHAELKQDNYYLNEKDNYTFTLTLSNPLSNQAQILITVPNQISTVSSNCKSYLQTEGFIAYNCSYSLSNITITQSASSRILTTSNATIVLKFVDYFYNPNTDTSSDISFAISTSRNSNLMDKLEIDQQPKFVRSCSKIQNFLCKRCDSSQSQCLECYSDKISIKPKLQNHTCQEECDDGYYADSNQICKQCNTYCKECTENACSNCDEGYELNVLKDVQKLNINIIKVVQIAKRIAIHVLILLQHVLFVNLHFYYIITNVRINVQKEHIKQVIIVYLVHHLVLHVLKVDHIYAKLVLLDIIIWKRVLNAFQIVGINNYKSGTNCVICESPCNNCQSPTICIDCVANYYLFNSSCINSIPNGYYLSGSKFIKCPDTCGNCKSDIECTSCPTGQYLLEYQCIGQCPDKYYSKSYVCYSCDSTCLQCTSSTICTSCPTGQYHLLGKCYSNCPNAYYISGTECLSCQSSCYTCTNNSYCDSCAQTKYMQDKLCVQSCSTNYYINATQTCAQCSNECSTCNSTGCLTCTTYYKYFNQTCLSDCPTGYKDINSTGICSLWTDNDETVSGNLANNKYIPVPFTIIMLVLMLSVVVAKIQKNETFIPGSIVGLCGLLVVGSWIVLLLLQIDYILSKLETYLIIAALGIHLLLNLSNLCFIKKCINGDTAFELWYAANKANKASFMILNFLSTITFSLTRFYFSRYFGFRFLKCKLMNVEEIQPLNIINGFCVLFSCAPAIVGSVLLAYRDTLREQLFISSIDSFIVTILWAICLIWETQKDDSFFEEVNYASLSQSHQVIPEFFQSKQNSKRFSFEDPTNMSKLNLQDEEPSFPKIDESAEFKENDSQEINQTNVIPQQFMKQNSSELTFTKQLHNPEIKKNKQNTQDEIILQINNEKSEPLSIGESIIEEQHNNQQEEINRLEEENRQNEEMIKQKQIEEQQLMQEKERILKEEQEKQLLLEKLIQEQEEQRKIKEEQQKLEEDQRQQKLEEEQRQQLESEKIEQQKIDEAKRIEQEKIELEKKAQQEKEEEEKRIEEEKQKLEEIKKEEEKRQQELLMEEQKAQEQREKDMLQQLEESKKSQDVIQQNEIEQLRLQVENLDKENKVNNVILVDENDDDVGWHMNDEGEENQDQEFNLNIQNKQSQNVVKDEQNEPDDDWDVPTSGFISVQQKSQLNKDNQIDEPTNPFQLTQQQAAAANSDLFKQSYESDDDEDWAANQVSPSDFNVLNQRFDNDKHSITQVQEQKKFSNTGQNFNPLQKKKTLPEPQINSDNESYEQQSVFDQFAKNHVSNIPKKKQGKGLEKIYLQRLAQKQNNNTIQKQQQQQTNLNYEDIQF